MFMMLSRFSFKCYVGISVRVSTCATVKPYSTGIAAANSLSQSSATGLKLTPKFSEYFSEQHRKYEIYTSRLEKLDFDGPTEMNDLMKKVSRLRDIAEQWKTYNNLREEMKELKELLMDKSMRDLALDDMRQAEKSVAEIENSMMQSILEEAMSKSEESSDFAVVEIRGCVGGDEANLFAGDIFEMYFNFCRMMGWTFQVSDETRDEKGGLKEAVVRIEGPDCYKLMKFEGGIHRVQRVPATETQGRVHTSTVSVAVLPKPVKVNVRIDEKDIKIECMRAGGKGGQHVNCTDSAVMITHIPTKIIVKVMSERSQHMNRAHAMEILQSRLFHLEQSKVLGDRSNSRKTQVGSGVRSEKIRTYNFPSGRITDHRINKDVYGIDAMLKGEHLETFHQDLVIQEEFERLKDLENSLNEK